LLAGKGFNLENIGFIIAIYPAVWGLGQLITGKLADIYCKRDLLFLGMLIQGLSILILVFAQTIAHYVVICIILGIGTAIVYPTFLAGIVENTNPQQRAKSLGVFRFWRDLGYAIGALLTGISADIFGLQFSIIIIGLLTLFSSGVILFRMKCSPSGKKIISRFKTFLTHTPNIKNQQLFESA
jgi:MFS family permease